MIRKKSQNKFHGPFVNFITFLKSIITFQCLISVAITSTLTFSQISDLCQRIFLVFMSQKIDISTMDVLVEADRDAASPERLVSCEQHVSSLYTHSISLISGVVLFTFSIGWAALDLFTFTRSTII